MCIQTKTAIGSFCTFCISTLYLMSVLMGSDFTLHKPHYFDACECA